MVRPRLGRTVRDTLNLIHELDERKIGLRATTRRGRGRGGAPAIVTQLRYTSKRSNSGEVVDEGLHVLRKDASHQRTYLAELAKFPLGAKQ